MNSDSHVELEVDDEAWEREVLEPDDIVIASGDLEQIDEAELRDEAAALAALRPEGARLYV